MVRLYIKAYKYKIPAKKADNAHKKTLQCLLSQRFCACGLWAI